MANNNECALSQTSGYTSNSNSTNNFDLKKIESIGLDRPSYGVDLSERLEDINENFNKIIESDFLRGAPGRSISISTWIFNNETKDTPMGQSLVDAIMSNNPSTTTTTTTTSPAPTTTTTTTTPEIDPLTSVIVGALIGKEIKAILDEDGHIVSSLPFTFIDPRFSNVVTLNESLADETDLSCVLIYETTTDSEGFVAAQTFPTLYWDTDIDGGNFCWKINGQKTGLVCKGPRGNDGSGGTLYTVLYNPEATTASNGSTACEIIGAMCLNVEVVDDIKNEFIPTSEFQNKQISIKTGDTVIALPGSIDENGNISFATPSTSSIGTTVTSDTTAYEYSITPAFVTNDNNYYVVISGATIRIPYVLQGGVLSNLMNMIGDPYMLGLYIPSEKSNGSISKAHTLWSDRSNPSNFCIGQVADPDEVNKWDENPTLVSDPSSVSLLYDEVSVGKDVKMNISSSLKNGTHIVEMAPNDKRNVSVEALKFKGYYHPGLRNASGLVMEYNFQSSVSIGGVSHIFSTCQLIRVGGDQFEHVTHIIDNRGGDDLFILWDRDLVTFEQFLQIWFDCKKNGEHAAVQRIDLRVADLDNLRFEDGMYVCDGYITSEKPFTFITSNAGGFMIDKVECDDIIVTYSGTEYSIKTGTGYDKLSSPTLTITTDIDQSKNTIIPFEYRDAYESFLITEFTSPKVIDQVYIDSNGENRFDTSPTMLSPKYRLSPYRYSLNQKFDSYNGNFTDQYNVSSHLQYAAFDESYIGGQNIGLYDQILDEVYAYEIPEEIIIHTNDTSTYVALSIPLIEHSGVWGSIYADGDTLYLIGYGDKQKHINLLGNMADAALKGRKYVIEVSNPTTRMVGGEDTTPIQSLQILSGTKAAFDRGQSFKELIFGTIEVPANVHQNVAKLTRRYNTKKNIWELSDGNFVGGFKPLEYIVPYIDIDSADKKYWVLKSASIDSRYNSTSTTLLKGNAPDWRKYKLIFPKAHKYVLGYEYGTVCAIPNEYKPSSEGSFSTNIEWYGKDTSRSTNIEKITYRCKEFQLNDYDLITKIAELEQRIKTLEDGAK